MDLRVVEQSESELVIEIGDEDHTFMNVLKSALLELDAVAAATYDMNPEQSGGQTEPLLSVKAEDGENPIDALEAGAARVNEQLSEFRSAYESAAK